MHYHSLEIKHEQDVITTIVTDFCCHRDIEKGSSSVARVFQKIPCLASREINLGNYIEHLCHRILGGDRLHLLPAILNSCYNST